MNSLTMLIQAWLSANDARILMSGQGNVQDAIWLVEIKGKTFALMTRPYGRGLYAFQCMHDGFDSNEAMRAMDAAVAAIPDVSGE